MWCWKEENRFPVSLYQYLLPSRYPGAVPAADGLSWPRCWARQRGVGPNSLQRWGRSETPGAKMKCSSSIETPPELLTPQASPSMCLYSINHRELSDKHMCAPISQARAFYHQSKPLCAWPEILVLMELK